MTIVPAIDLSDILNIELYTPAQLNSIMQAAVEQTTDRVYSKIRELARAKSKYLDGLEKHFEPYTGIITLTKFLPLAIEEGKSPYDMKEGFANSPKAKRSEENQAKFNKGEKIKKTEAGWYLTIPFRWGTAGSKGVEFSNVMDKAINTIAENLRPSIQYKPNEKVIWDDKITMDQLKNLNSGFAKIKTRAAYGEFGSYTHQSPIASGMVKIVKDYERGSGSTYMSFRRVSSKSNANAWIHPGFKAEKFMDKAMEMVDVDKLLERMIYEQLQTQITE